MPPPAPPAPGVPTNSQIARRASGSSPLNISPTSNQKNRTRLIHRTVHRTGSCPCCVNKSVSIPWPSTGLARVRIFIPPAEISMISPSVHLAIEHRCRPNVRSNWAPDWTGDPHPACGPALPCSSGTGIAKISITIPRTSNRKATPPRVSPTRTPHNRLRNTHGHLYRPVTHPKSTPRYTHA